MGPLYASDNLAVTWTNKRESQIWTPLAACPELVGVPNKLLVVLYVFEHK